MKNIIFTLVVLLLIGCKNNDVTNNKYSSYPIKAADIKNITLTDSFWLPKIKTVQETTIQFALDKCKTEGRMESFLIAGGEKKGKVRGKMPFDDTDLYKIIEGASYSLINYPNTELDAYLDTLINIIKTGQEEDGYLTTWFTINPKNPPAEWVKPSGRRWHNLKGHELYNSGHLFEAAAAHYLATNKRNFLDIALKNADLLVKNFGSDTLKIPPGHQIVETGLIKLYQITGNDDYLELSKFFLDIRGDEKTHALEGSYSQDHKPVTLQKEAVGHAVRAVYMYAGMTDIAAIYNDTAYRNAVNCLWENVVNKKMYITGGIGARHSGEAFGENYELPNKSAYNETCAAIGNVYWNHRLFQLTGNAKYYDVIERTLYNGLISGISPDGTKFFYPNPLESDANYAFNQGACTRQSWFDCSCCPTNLIRFVPSIPRLIYAIQKDSLYINLYMSNQAKLNIDGSTTKIIQKTEYPLNGAIQISVNPQQEKDFTIKLRIPGWMRNKPLPGNLYSYAEELEIPIILKINGSKESAKIANDYIVITRKWKKGDTIEVNYPLAVRKVISNELVVENKGKVALEFGPIVYCAEEVDNNTPIDELTLSQASYLIPVRVKDLIENEDLIVLTNAGMKQPIFVPYYAWSNRRVGKMKVWFPTTKN